MTSLPSTIVFLDCRRTWRWSLAQEAITQRKRAHCLRGLHLWLSHGRQLPETIAYFVDVDTRIQGAMEPDHNTARVYTPDDKAIQTPNSDTPYSQLGLDLRAEPIVLTVPPVESNVTSRCN